MWRLWRHGSFLLLSFSVSGIPQPFTLCCKLLSNFAYRLGDVARSSRPKLSSAWSYASKCIAFLCQIDWICSFFWADAMYNSTIDHWFWQVTWNFSNLDLLHLKRSHQYHVCYFEFAWFTCHVATARLHRSSYTSLMTAGCCRCSLLLGPSQALDSRRMCASTCHTHR